MGSDRFGGSVGGTRRNAVLGWLTVALLVAVTIRQGTVGSYRWFSLSALAIALMVAPAVALRDPYAVRPGNCWRWWRYRFSTRRSSARLSSRRLPSTSPSPRSR